MNQVKITNEIVERNDNDAQKMIDYYVAQVDEAIDCGQYWKATELMGRLNQFVDKSEWASKSQILYDMDWDKFFKGMCCYASADSCLSGVGGCSGCGGCLCGAYCLCYCCTGENPAQGCDCMMNCWNNCWCIDILCGKGCEC